jgi:hypothetical protein
MFKLISITTIAVAALLSALLAVDMSRPGRSSSQRMVTTPIPQKKVVAMAVEFHAQVLKAASQRLDSTVKQLCRGNSSAQHVAYVQEEESHNGISAQ